MPSLAPTPRIELNLLFPTLRIQGSLALEASHRVSDHLNGDNETVMLENAVVTALDGSHVDTFSELTVEKRHILLATPKESADYLVARRLARFGVARPLLVSVPVGIVVPPFTVRGVVLLSPPINAWSISKRLTNFFPVTKAALQLSGVVIEESEVFLVNRQFAIALGQVNEASSPSKSTMALP
jgi:hypothetical protein